MLPRMDGALASVRHTTKPSEHVTNPQNGLRNVKIVDCEKCIEHFVRDDCRMSCGHTLCKYCVVKSMSDVRKDIPGKGSCLKCWEPHEDFVCGSCGKDTSYCTCSSDQPSSADYFSFETVRDQLGYLETFSVSDSDCLICLGKDGRTVKALSCCLQPMHSDCLDLWLAQDRSCPHCRLKDRNIRVIDEQEVVRKTLLRLHPVDDQGIKEWLRDNPKASIRDFHKGFYPEDIYIKMYPERTQI